MQMNESIVNNAYAFIMNKIGIKENDNGKIQALSCSPYLYLQILYQFQGVPNNVFESFLAIDEAQGIALVKADDMIDFVQQALKMANQKDKN